MNKDMKYYDLLGNKKLEFPQVAYSYSKYWGNWSRVLWTDGVSYIEVNLTPINPMIKGVWEEQVVPVMVRWHWTAKEKGEELVQNLPHEVYCSLLDHVGEDLGIRLTIDDLLAEIDLERLRKDMRGGGVPLSEVKKG